MAFLALSGFTNTHFIIDLIELKQPFWYTAFTMSSKKKVRFAIYARVSSEDRDQDSET